MRHGSLPSTPSPATACAERLASRAEAGRSKKSAHALEQERPDVLKRRQDWFAAQPDLDPQSLVFIE